MSEKIWSVFSRLSEAEDRPLRLRASPLARDHSTDPVNSTQCRAVAHSSPLGYWMTGGRGGGGCAKAGRCSLASLQS